MNPRRTSIAATAAAAAVMIAVLMLARLSVNPASLPMSRQPVAQTMPLPEYAELLESLNSPAQSNPSPAYNPTDANSAAQAPPEGGPDISDAGAAAMAPAQTTSAQPSPVSRRERTNPPETGPTQQQRHEEQARRQAQHDIANAFANNDDANTNSPGTHAGNAGTPSGSESPVNGAGSGTVGGGWIMPSYAKLPSRQLGSIRLRATVDSSGAVTSVVQIGGEAPASADGDLVERCKAEVRARSFTRTDGNAPTTATAFITYIFK